ncbi:MAG: HD domain-containing protein [Lachnospiraceae bacterium]|nr:HD domain-containing protein [Lachnospiraceae bacterium]
MRFVRTDDLTKGMRLAKPVYNRNGVLLYDRNTKLTKQGINSIQNFGLIGIYILEPTEPLPPMTEEDIEFERFQTMSVFGIKEDLQNINNGKAAPNINNIINIIIKNFAKKTYKANFQQNHRSCEDYIYKHSLSVAILSTLMCERLGVEYENMKNVIFASLIHDVGKLNIPASINVKKVLTDEEKNTVMSQEKLGVKGVMSYDENVISADVKKLVVQKYELQNPKMTKEKMDEYPILARIMQAAEEYDSLTAMKLGEDPVSDIVAIRKMQASGIYEEKLMDALLDSLKILVPGVCIELSNGTTGLVIRGNSKDVFKPMVLCFNDNQLYDFEQSNVNSTVQIKDAMKTLDRRVKIDQAIIDEYMKKYGKLKR